MRELLIVVPVLAAVVIFVRAVSQNYVRSRCTETAEGKLIDMDTSAEGTGGSIGGAVYNAIYFPIYEYVVNGIAYWARFDRKSRNPGAFEKSVSVQYNPNDPEICFVKGLQGKVIARYDKNEYDKKSGGVNLTSDYKWRP